MTKETHHPQILETKSDNFSTVELTSKVFFFQYFMNIQNNFFEI